MLLPDVAERVVQHVVVVNGQVPAGNRVAERIVEFFGRKDDNLSPCQATTSEAIDKCLSSLATFLKREGKLVLQGDRSTFQALFKIQKELSSQFLDDIKLSRTRIRATGAWQARDYLEVVRLFEPVRDRLTPAELRKLEYAKKRSIDDSY